MLERAPFKLCPKCSADNALGTLWVGGTSLTRRCKNCGIKIYYELPKLRKKIIYLDQNAISNIFNVSSSKTPKIGNRDFFWRKVSELSRKIFLLQQAVFPLSDIHRDETLVYLHAEALNLTHEMLGGDTSFVDSEAIITAQTIDFLEKFLSGEAPPSVNFDPEDAITGMKDKWISDLHITASMDFSVFAEEIRADRDAISPAYDGLLKHWEERRPTFKEALRVELEGYGIENKRALQLAAGELASAIERGDFNAAMKETSKRIYKQFITLRFYIEKFGIPKSESTSKVFDFWNWKGNYNLPHNKISSYLFAALARRISSGQRNKPSISIFNDFRAISTYAPYVDAMFLDNECANLLNEEPLKTELGLSAKAFSTKTGDNYIGYLEDIETNTPEAVRAWANEIYGLN